MSTATTTFDDFAAPRSFRLFSPTFLAKLRRLIELNGAAYQVAGSRYL